MLRCLRRCSAAFVGPGYVRCTTRFRGTKTDTTKSQASKLGSFFSRTASDTRMIALRLPGSVRVSRFKKVFTRLGIPLLIPLLAFHFRLPRASRHLLFSPLLPPLVRNTSDRKSYTHRQFSLPSRDRFNHYRLGVMGGPCQESSSRLVGCVYEFFRQAQHYGKRCFLFWPPRA